MPTNPIVLPISLHIIILIITLTFSTTPQQQTCLATQDLTPQQLTRLSKFTTAAYLPSDQQNNLRTAYQSLNRTLGKYFIQIEEAYQFETNDIEECIYLPKQVTFNSMDDVWICLRQYVMVLKCNKEWELKIGCGTFIELHKPFDTQVIAKIMLSEIMLQPQAFSMTLVDLCAGTYHLWFVYSVRAGKIIKNVKPIFVSYPSCFC